MCIKMFACCEVGRGEVGMGEVGRDGVGRSGYRILERGGPRNC